MKTAVFLIILLICTIRTVNYGIYTIRDKNKTGGAGIFAIAIITIAASVYFLIE